MAAINHGRVLLGGLVGGVIANIGDFIVNSMVMADDMVRMAQRLNLNQAVMASPAVGMTWVVVDFVYATLIVWTYAAIRPRFGPGPGTAIKSGMVLWAAVCSVLFGFQSMGIFTRDSFFKSAVLSLATTILAALAGAWTYKEENESRKSLSHQ
jgi:hypothetical protein